MVCHWILHRPTGWILLTWLSSPVLQPPWDCHLRVWVNTYWMSLRWYLFQQLLNGFLWNFIQTLMFPSGWFVINLWSFNLSSYAYVVTRMFKSGWDKWKNRKSNTCLSIMSTTVVPFSKTFNPNYSVVELLSVRLSHCGCTGHHPGVNVRNCDQSDQCSCKKGGSLSVKLDEPWINKVLNSFSAVVCV